MGEVVVEEIKFYKFAPEMDDQIKRELTPIPGFDPNYVMAHCPTGHIWRAGKGKGKWLLQGSKGTGDRLPNGEGKYLLTSLKNLKGENKHYYVHHLIFASAYGLYTVEEMIEKGWEINHRSRNHPFNTRMNNIDNLEQSDRKSQYTDDVLDDMKQRTVLNMEIVKQLREEWKDRDIPKVRWYFEKSLIHNTCSRTIQNAILSNTYKEITE